MSKTTKKEQSNYSVPLRDTNTYIEKNVSINPLPILLIIVFIVVLVLDTIKDV